MAHNNNINNLEIALQSIAKLSQKQRDMLFSVFGKQPTKQQSVNQTTLFTKNYFKNVIVRDHNLNFKNTQQISQSLFCNPATA